MSLIIDVAVNEHILFTVAAQRITNTTTFVCDDSISVYRVTKFIRPTGTTQRSPRILVESEVKHRYGDGASVLARKALAAVE